MEFIISAALIVAAILIMRLVASNSMRVVWLSVVFGVSIASFLLRDWYKQRTEQIAARLLEQNADKLDRSGGALTVPTAVCRSGGRVLWTTPAFFMLARQEAVGHNIYHLLPELTKPTENNTISIRGQMYQKQAIRADYEGRSYLIYRLIETEHLYAAGEPQFVSSPTVCQIQIDNYDDVIRGVPQNKQSDIRTAVERIIAAQADELHALYQLYDRDKYLMVFERRKLGDLLKNKFAMLAEARAIDTGIMGVYPTLSIGVGLGDQPDTANSNAWKALEMALSRGGDQAVLKGDDGFKFFGGIQQGREKRTRVKARMFAQALRSLMEQSDKTIIMGHHVPDLDCMSAALGLLACARSIQRKCYIVLDRSNAAISTLVDRMRENPAYRGVLVDAGEAANMIDDKSILIVVDTQIGSLTIAPQLLVEAVTTVVIDHHVRGTEYIENATLFLHEPYASSTAEMVTEIIEYFSDDVKLLPLEAEALLAGITMDTKGFSFKTGERTFEAASFLRRLGADTTRIRHLFQDDLDVYTERARVVENAQILPDGIAIATCPRNAAAPQLLAAQAADALLGIRGVEASFVLCQTDGQTIISGRSLGVVNVQRILEKLGGGGHATIAGAQLKGVSESEARSRLLEKIKEYEEEVGSGTHD